MHLEIITPETKIFTGSVEAVQLPGLDGLFQVLKGHAPIISALKEGEVKVNLSAPFADEEEKMSKYLRQDQKDNKLIFIPIKGGVIEMLNDKIIVLAE